MQYHYIKKDGLYLHIKQSEHEELQDNSDISSMYSQQFVFLKSKDGAKKFLNVGEANTYLIKHKLKRKGAAVMRE
jgi:hypothetical protein